MKSICIVAILGLFSSSVFASDNSIQSDSTLYTTLAEVKHETVTLPAAFAQSQQDDGSNISYNGSSYSFFFSWKKRSELHGHWGGVGMGFMNYNDSNIPYGDLKGGSSRNFSFNFSEYSKQFSNSNLLFVTGLGIDWSRYHFDGNAALTKVNGTTIFQPAPEELEYEDSKLLAYYLTVPLLLEYQFEMNDDSHLFLSAGAVGYLKCYSKSQVKYRKQGSMIKEDMGNGLNLRSIDLRLRFQAGIDNVSLVGYYSPFSLFEKGKGPELNTYSLGLQLNF